MQNLSPRSLIFTAFIIFNSISFVYGQSYGFGLKGGLTGASQAWENQNRANSLMLAWHVAAYIESQDNTEDKYSIFSQLGYHIRGSATRFGGGVGFGGIIIEPRTFRQEFKNISLALGGKRKYPSFSGHQWFYSFAVRGEYTLDYNLEYYATLVLPEDVRRFNFGISVGTGYQLNIREKVGILLELQVQPDFSRQVFVPPLRWNNPHTGQIQPLPEQSIRNLSVELSAGFRLLRKIEYEDDYYEY